MIYYESTALQAVCLHLVGNKTHNEGILLSESPMRLEETMLSTLTRFFIAPFKSDERYSFFHHSGLEFNFVYKVISSVFEDPNTFYQSSVMLAKHLYESSTHSKIRGGEFYLAYFKDIEIDGLLTDAVGLFKTENKDTYFRVVNIKGNHELEQELGININKLDKGCLIFNLKREEGYIITVIDNTNKLEAKYWVEDFIQAKQRSDDYKHTQTLLRATKDFINKELPIIRNVSRGEQAEMMDKAFRFFVDNDRFEMDDFNNKVMREEDLSSGFNEFVNVYLAKNDLETSDGFVISEKAVRRSARSMRSVIKLDKNFHIYVHGGEGMIKKGHDEATGMAYYQLFFLEEG